MCCATAPAHCFFSRLVPPRPVKKRHSCCRGGPALTCPGLLESLRLTLTQGLSCSFADHRGTARMLAREGDMQRNAGGAQGDVPPGRPGSTHGSRQPDVRLSRSAGGPRLPAPQSMVLCSANRLHNPWCTTPKEDTVPDQIKVVHAIYLATVASHTQARARTHTHTHTHTHTPRQQSQGKSHGGINRAETAVAEVCVSHQFVDYYSSRALLMRAPWSHRPYHRFLK